MSEQRTDREIIEVLATRVMGWERRWRKIDGRDSWNWIEPPSTKEIAFVAANELWNPLESWADAGMLLNKLAADGRWWARVQTPWDPARKHETEKLGQWMAGISPAGFTGWNGLPDHRAYSEEGQRAISLAFYEWALAQPPQAAAE